MKRPFDEVLVDYENDVFHRRPNENPLPTRNQVKCKPTRWFNLSNITIAIWSFLLLSSIISLAIYLGIRQHMNGPGILWPKAMVNATANLTTKVKLPLQHSHHSWQNNTMILRAWLGTCLGVGSFIGLTLILLVCHFLWKKYKKNLKNDGSKVRKETDFGDRDIMEMKGLSGNITETNVIMDS